VDRKKTLGFCGIILLVGACLTALIFSTEPTATRVAATRQTAMLVDVMEVQQGDYRPTIVGMGTVEPAQDITLSPRVGGEVVSLSPAFTPGGFVQKGEALLQIDPADYKNTLQQRKSELQQALSDLNVEMGRQNVALKDYQLLDEALANEYKTLVLREPQLNAARAKVQAAQAAVDQAQLELERTSIKAPFKAHILSRNVSVGSQVSPRDNLGRLVGLDSYWVVTTVPMAKLPWLSLPKTEAETGSVVHIRNRVAWQEDTYRTGSLHRMVGALEDQTRLARVYVSVPDPLSYQPESSDLPPLMIGAFVETGIEAKPIKNAVRIGRNYVRANDTVWLIENEKLRIQPVKIAFRDADYAYITEGLRNNDQVVITNLSKVAEGAPLRIKDMQQKNNPTSEDTRDE
jgi:RND family efflux transporter MFP subunit